MATSEPRGEGANTDHPEARGGCLNLGWGCLPLFAVFLTLPVSLFF